MATITKIEKKKGAKERMDVFVDGRLFGTFSFEIILKYALSEGYEAELPFFNQIAEENARIVAFEYALAVVARGNYTKQQMQEKLKNKGFFADPANFAVLKLTELGYLDDLRFAEDFVTYQGKMKGDYKMRQELKMKGVDSEIIEQVMQQHDEVQQARAFCKDFLRRNTLDDPKNKDKLIRGMQYRGFRWETISGCLQEVKAQDDTTDL